MKFLVQLVGDSHQPLHCGCEYYEIHGHQAVLINDPEMAYQHPTDKGANDLGYGESHFQQRHGFWETTLRERVANSPDYRKRAGVLKSQINLEGWQTPVDYHQWAEFWVVDSIREARGAYECVVFQEAEVGKNGKLKAIHVRLPEGYEMGQINRAADQI